MASKGNSVEKAQKNLQNALIERYENGYNIRRSADPGITINDRLSISDAISALRNFEEGRNKNVSDRVTHNGHIGEIMHAFVTTLREDYGEYVLGDAFMEAFGIPGQSKTIQLDWNETETVPVGPVQVPGLPIEMQIGIAENSKNLLQSTVICDFTYKKMYEPLVSDIKKGWARRLKTNSIFKGKAVQSGTWTFIDVNVDTSRLVHSAATWADIKANVLAPVYSREFMKARGQQIKRTILFYGKYGTGKTLTARYLAKEALENEYTFVLVRPGDEFVPVLTFAQEHQPCMVFCEDIDRAAGTTRSDAVNLLLNSIDGLLSSKSDVVTVVTTNDIEGISPAMLRPGRIDHIIEMGVLDPDAICELVRVYLGDALEGDLDPIALYKAAADYTPAFAAEGTHQAQLFAMASHGKMKKGDTMPKITSADVENAFKSLRLQFNQMVGNEKVRLERAHIEDNVEDVKGGVTAVDGKVMELAENVTEMYKYIQRRM